MAPPNHDEAIAKKAQDKLNIKADDVSMSGSSDESDSGSEGDWMDVDGTGQDGGAGDDDGEKLTYVSLVDDRKFDDVTDMLAYCKKGEEGKEGGGVDFLEVRDRLGLDFVGCIRLVNFSGFSPSSFLLFLSS